MDNSIYYDGREEADQSPVISPLSPTFDRYMSRGVDEPTYFTNPSAGYSTLQGGDAYSMGSRGSVSADQREAGFPLDFLPTGETLPRAYPGGTLDPSVTTNDPTFYDMNSTRALYDDRDSSEEAQLRSYGGQSFDGSYGFLPSPPDVEDSIDCAEGPSGSRKKDKKKRRSGGNGGKEKQGDEKRPHRPTTQLRTASRAPKRYSQATARKPAESVEEVKARAAHNQVEQQYRKRLNQQFERLLAVLPQPDYDEDGMEVEDGEGGSRGAMEKRISKAEVLDLARRRIKVLEKERANLERQKRELAGSVGRLQDEWTRRLGGSVPVKTER